MNSVFSILFPGRLFTQEYKNHDEYLSDLVKQVELLLVYFLECAPPPQQHLDKFKGLVITKNQVEDVFQNNQNINQNRDGVRREFSKAEFFIQSRLQGSVNEGQFFAFEYIKSVFKLTELESFFLVLSMLPIIDNKYEKVFAYLQDDITQKRAGYELALRLYYFVDDVSDIEDFYEVRASLEEKMSALCFLKDTTDIDPRLLSFIMSNGKQEINIKGVYCYASMNDQPLPVMDDIAQRIASVVKGSQSNRTMYFYLNGPQNIGKKTQVKRFSEIMNISVIMIDITQIEFKTEKLFYDIIITACREAVINQGAICFYNFDELFSAQNENAKYIDMILEAAEKFSSVIFILSKSPMQNRDVTEQFLWIDVPVRYPDKEESIILWDICLESIPLDEEIKSFEIANKFTFTPGQIMNTGKEAQKQLLWSQSPMLTRKELYSCAYNQVVHDLNRQATLIYAKYTWDELILAKEQKEMLQNACDQIKYKHIVYDKWGFKKRLAYGRGVSMLFAGPPGTGKTMAAQVVANELNIEIYKVDLSQIVSKYIGETEKNLSDLFNEAKKSNVILFFDETDALLGKRTEVKDSHDKNANLETSYLLQKMEEYDGITVMSTNYLENIDSAFFRRISYVIHFPFPDVQSRKRIWQTIFPKQMPISKDIDFDYLAQQFEIAGGNIKNIAVTSAFLAAKSSKKLEMKHIIQAIKYELTKQGKTLLKEDFGEHGYLLK